MNKIDERRGFFPVALICLSLLLACTSRAVIPSPEKLLPDDTLVVVTSPDLAKARQAWKQLPQSQLWNDPALRAFKEKFLAKWNDELVTPLERELKIRFNDYTSLLQGQLTFAVTRNGWDGGDNNAPGVLVLLDAKEKSGQLKSALSDVRKRWSESGKALRTEKIRDVEFAVLSISSNDVPKTLRKLLPKQPEVQEVGDDSQKKDASSKDELVFGQVESLLIVGNSTKAVEKIVARLTGGTLPALGDLAAYQANHATLFRDSPVYAWVNVKTFLDIWLRQAGEKKDNPDAPNPFDIRPEKVINALGLNSLKTVAACVRTTNDGELFQLFLGVPESARQGLFKILSGETKELNPPPFVPADAIKFQRWRIDGQKTWAALEKMLGDISPQWLSGVNFLIETANTAGKDKDAGFDVRKNLIGNLGDDIIYYEKGPRAGGAPGSGPGLTLFASPNPEQLAAALKGVFVFFGQQPGTPPDQREFLGRKVFSVPLGTMGLPIGGASAPSLPRTLHYAASGGYVALSSDVSTLEEYLRNCDTQGKTLRDTAGLADAMQKVTGPGAAWFGYENEVETMRATLGTLRKLGGATGSSSGDSASPSSTPVALSGLGRNLQEWLDFSLLPPFERISKYFSFSVYGGSVNADGISCKMFVPTPTGLKGGESK
jgi:hypothetical protein